MESLKVCTTCKQEPVYKHYYSLCKECGRTKAREYYRKSDKKQYKHNWLKRKFGITLDIFNEMLEQQDNKCAICSKMIKSRENRSHMKNVACVDHNHTTGKVRQLLCNECNWALGLVEENINTMKGMIAYIEKHNHAQ